jgi:hypothetical protein
MKIQIGRYVIKGPVLRLLLLACLLLGIIIGVLYALREEGKSISWLPMIPAIPLITKLMKNAYADFKKDNELD